MSTGQLCGNSSVEWRLRPFTVRSGFGDKTIPWILTPHFNDETKIVKFGAVKTEHGTQPRKNAVRINDLVFVGKVEPSQDKARHYLLQVKAEGEKGQALCVSVFEDRSEEERFQKVIAQDAIIGSKVKENLSVQAKDRSEEERFQQVIAQDAIIGSKIKENLSVQAIDDTCADELQQDTANIETQMADSSVNEEVHDHDVANDWEKEQNSCNYPCDEKKTPKKRAKNGRETSKRKLQGMAESFESPESLSQFHIKDLRGGRGEEFTKHIKECFKKGTLVVDAHMGVAEALCTYLDALGQNRSTIAEAEDRVKTRIHEQTYLAELYPMELMACTVLNRLEHIELEDLYVHLGSSPAEKKSALKAKRADVGWECEGIRTVKDYIGTQWKKKIINLMWELCCDLTPNSLRDELAGLEIVIRGYVQNSFNMGRLLPQLCLDAALNVQPKHFTTSDVPLVPETAKDTKMNLLKLCVDAPHWKYPSLLKWGCITEENYYLLPLLKVAEDTEVVDDPLSKYAGWRNPESLDTWLALFWHIMLSTYARTKVFNTCTTSRSLAYRCNSLLQCLEQDPGISILQLIDVAFLGKVGPEVMILASFADELAYPGNRHSSPVNSFQNIVLHFFHVLEDNRAVVRKNARFSLKVSVRSLMPEGHRAKRSKFSRAELVAANQ